MPMSGVVYVLSSPAMPGIVKIGRTSQSDVQLRIAQLYGTGVPVPFSVEFAARVPNPTEVERALHIAFAPQRLNPRREFFRIEPEQAIVILRLLHVEDATAEFSDQSGLIDQESLAAAETLRRRRPVLNFVEMGIPLEGRLSWGQSEIEAIVVSPRTVSLNGEEMSLSAATRAVSDARSSGSNPDRYWFYRGRSLREIYDETYRPAGGDAEVGSGPPVDPTEGVAGEGRRPEADRQPLNPRIELALQALADRDADALLSLVPGVVIPSELLRPEHIPVAPSWTWPSLVQAFALTFDGYDWEQRAAPQAVEALNGMQDGEADISRWDLETLRAGLFRLQRMYRDSPEQPDPSLVERLLSGILGRVSGGQAVAQGPVLRVKGDNPRVRELLASYPERGGADSR